MRRILLPLLGVLLLAGCSSSMASAHGAPAAHPSSTPAPTRSATASAANTDQPCGHTTTAPTYRHIIWIWMENHSYSSVIGNSSAPYENSLAHECGLATNYHSITHPSLPNYLAATGGSTFGVSDDAAPGAHPINMPSIFQQVSQAGQSWRAYEESMPSPCTLSDSGEYAVKHNPAAYYTPIRSDCQRWDVPFDSLTSDIPSGGLPSFTFITPNLCHDTHDCPVTDGDAWLSQWVPKLLAGPNYTAGDTALVITWDEGSGGDHVPAIVVSPSTTPGTASSMTFDHYSLLRTTEEMLGLPFLGQAANASSMRSAFHL